MTQNPVEETRQDPPDPAQNDGWGSLSWFQNKYRAQGNSSAAGYFGHSANAFQRMRHVELIAFCKRHTERTPSVIVDYGCATGVLTAQFAQAFPDATVRGYDFVPELVDEASMGFANIEFAVNALPTVELEAKDGTLVVLSEVLYYLSDADRRRTLSSLRTTAHGDLWIVLASAVGPRHFTKESAEALLRDCGFEPTTETFALPIYKKIIGYCAAFESVCAEAETGAAPRGRIRKLARSLWRFAPSRWAMKLVRVLTGRLVASQGILRLALKFEDTARGREKSATNLMIHARPIR